MLHEERGASFANVQKKSITFTLFAIDHFADRSYFLFIDQIIPII